jgi:4-hydroxythreonine-4-phosphate dehydrogenase
MIKPRIALAIGDPAGIGPEIAILAAQDQEVQNACTPVLYGPVNILRRLNPNAEIQIVNSGDIPEEVFLPGRILAVEAVLAGDCAAVATAPLNKESLRASGCADIGYTEILASLCGKKAREAVTMFDTLGLRIFFLTRHLSLANAVKAVKKEALYEFILQVDVLLRRLGTMGPIAVAGLNPHCGEHGLFGDEEGLEIEPAIGAARKAGVNVEGPIGADSVFHQAKIGRYAAVISLYHDQGHIAAKTLDFNRTVSFTLGLPVLRASVDHGTAFDIAWRGLADATSMKTTLLRLSDYINKQRG